MGLITGCGADVVRPALWYVITRNGKSILRHVGMRPDRPIAIAEGVFGLTAAWEMAQRFHWIPGSYDPFDLLACAIGVIVPLLIDRWLCGHDRLQSA